MSAICLNGHQNSDGSLFCRMCGSPIEKMVDDSGSAPETSPTPDSLEPETNSEQPGGNGDAAANPKQRSNRGFLYGFIGLVVVLALAGIVSSAVARLGGVSTSSASEQTDSTSPVSDGSLGNASSNSGESAESSEPIEEARAILAGKWGSSATYAEIKSVTDSALLATGLALTDDMRSRAWSAVLVVSDKNAINPMTVMRCVSTNGAQAAMTFPNLAAICAVSGG